MKSALGAFALFAVLGLALAARTLSWPMVFDDLHLIRVFTPAELASAWHGTWDPDGVETAGYRPLSLLFNHLRAAAFGENVVGHRVALVLLFAADLALLVPLFARLGLSWSAAVLAGALALTSRYAVYHYVWITDGNHLLQGLFFMAAAILLVDGLRGPSSWRLVLAIGAFAGALLVREDSAAALPALVMIGAWTAPATGRRAQVAWSSGALAAVAALFVARRLFVPTAQPLRLDIEGWLRAVFRVMNPVGWEWFDLPSVLFVYGWVVILGLTLIALVALRRRPMTRLALLWLAAAAAACAPALVLQRDDLFFFPSLFAALFLSTAWSALLEAQPHLRPSVAIGAAWALAGGAWVGTVFAENFHPLSARAVDWNTQMLYGEYQAARIPPARREAAAARLSALGIRPGEQPRQRVRELIQEAKQAGRLRPEYGGAVFFPRLPERYF